MGLQRETLEEFRCVGEWQTRVEGRVEELGRVVGLYREDFIGLREDFRSLVERYQEDFRSLLERFDHFQAEVRRENEAFRQEVRAENEKFRQAVGGRFEQIDERFEKIDARFERLEGRLFEMQRSLTIQTRWLVGLLVAAPVIYSVVDEC